MARILAVALVAILVAAAPADGAPAKVAPKAAAKAPAKAEPASDLDKAIAAMRHITPEDFVEGKREAKAQELDAAWQTITDAGKGGAARLKKEMAAIDAAKEKDDYFKLGASVLLWQIGGADEAAAIAGVWGGDVQLSLNYNYVFRTAMMAARTQDPRVAPMLVACLKDKKGKFFIVEHVMNVAWPLTLEFIWCAYGSKGAAALAEVLKTSKDPVTLESALVLLGCRQYLPALPRIRELATKGEGDVRIAALRALGFYGHPQDFDLLAKGLAAKDPKVQASAVFALYEYEDLRAAALVAPLLDSGDEAVCIEATALLGHLVTPASLEALHRHAVAEGASGSAKKNAEQCREELDGALKALGMSWDAYAAKPAKGKEAAIAALFEKAGQRHVRQPGDRAFTHDDLLKAAEEWKASGRITGGSYEWVEDRHALAASTADDIDLWLDVKAKVCLRMSDECLPEMTTIDSIIRRIGRSRYRKEVGITAKVQPAAAAAPAPAVKG